MKEYKGLSLGNNIFFELLAPKIYNLWTIMK